MNTLNNGDKMSQQTKKKTGKRKGSIQNIDIEFEVTAKFNGVDICEAEGEFRSPENAYQCFFGASYNLLDIKTGNNYQILVGNERFSFQQNYENIDQLFL